MKKALALMLGIVLMITLLVLPLNSCGGGTGDNGGDVGGDTPGGETGGESGGSSEPLLELIKNKTASFTIVSSQKDSEINGEVRRWIEKLSEYGVEVKHIADYSINKMQDCEILIGTGLIQRDKYNVDTHDFGEKGYVIKVQDDKVVICGGTTASTLEAIAIFFENYVGINVATDDIVDVSVSRTLELVKVQDDYPIKNLTVNGESIKDVYISASRSNSYAFAAAQELQAAFYSYAGVWLEIMFIEGDNSARVRFEFVEDAGAGGFRAFVGEDGNLTFNCSYKNAFAKGITAFISSIVATSGESLNFASDFNYETDVSVVKYSEFGAVGDGKTDDFEAIIAAHAYANEGGQLVKADPGKTYYIGSHRDTAIVKTNVDWGDAEFIIDDSGVSRADSGYWIFSAESDKAGYNVKIPENYSLSRGDTNVGLTFNSKVLLFVENENKSVYIRYGSNANDGSSQKEVLLVDKDGNIDPSTPLIFDYDEVTSIIAYSVDDKPITLQGGTFTTYANLGGNASKWCGYHRGIQVSRSNTTVKNVVHLVEKEPEITDAASKEVSCPYVGFFYAKLANNVLFDSCVMTSHLKYKHGTYDTQAARANNVTWKNCTQSDPLNRFSQGYWGVMASNYVKNLTFDGCALTRFDAHCGVYNVTIKDSEIGEVINLVGGGTCLIENSHLSSGAKNYFIRLREDYGGTWDGDLIIKNCKMSVKNNATAAYIVRADWNEHYFGYECHIPNLYVDGFEIKHLNGNDYSGSLYVFKKLNDSTEDYRNNETNPLFAPETITLKNIKHTYSLVQYAPNEKIFADTKVTNGDEE